METKEAPVMADDTRALKPAKFVDEYPDEFPSLAALQYHLKNRKQNGLLATGAVVEQRSNPTQERASLRIIPAKLHAYQSGQRISELSAGDEMIAQQLQEVISSMAGLELRLTAITNILERKA
jgi:hypothetical protein